MMAANEMINLIAIVVGPIAAVAITLWIENRRKNKDSKIIVLRMLLSTRHLPSDPGYSVAIQLVPIEFNDCRSVLQAHREFLDAANVPLDGKNDEQIVRNTRTKLTRMIYEMAVAVGLKLRETDIDTGSFGTKGFYERDGLLMDSQKAMRDVATILHLQSRIMASAPLTPQERNFLGLQEEN